MEILTFSRRFRRTVKVWVLPLVVALCAAAPALATPIAVLGGIDDVGQYACPAGSGPLPSSTCFGTLSFDGPDMGSDPGEVTSADPPTNPTLAAAVLGAEVSLEVVLGPWKNNQWGIVPFDPANTRVDRARFLGDGSDFVIRDPLSGNVLLAFDVNFIDVSSFTLENPPADPDGSLTVGAFSEASYGQFSALTLSGGTLNQLAGGPGQRAVLSVQMITLLPGLNFGLGKGYLGSNFLSGVGASPESGAVWDLTILPNVIPEPSTAALVGFGLLGLIASARRYARRE
jgi:hypothetical protein